MPECHRKASKVRQNEIVASKPARVVPAKEPELQGANSHNVDESRDGINGDGGSAPGLVGTRVATPQIDDSLSSPELYLNRELTWLAFNCRVLAEAEDERNPLLERLKFLAITASNLDEFFMKRIGGLKQQVVAGMQELTVDGRTPQQQIAECYAVVREQERRQRELGPQILAQLENYGIRLRPYSSLTAEERKLIREYYYKNIFPLVTPQAMDPAHPFPFVSNLSLNLLVTARYQNDSDPMMARVK